MTKEELKNYIKKLGLEKELEELIFELMDGAKEVNKVLINTIADILDHKLIFMKKQLISMMSWLMNMKIYISSYHY
jgi:hypothetical protein